MNPVLRNDNDILDSPHCLSQGEVEIRQAQAVQKWLNQYVQFGAVYSRYA
jgi:hypothetical protein